MVKKKNFRKTQKIDEQASLCFPYEEANVFVLSNEMGKDLITRAPCFFSEKALSFQPCQAGMLFLTGTETHSLQ